ncbi:MAG: energy-coupling factor transporter transmembrane protein EcfT, partial [Nocardioides sp.]
VYGLLDGTTSAWLGMPMLLAGSALAALGVSVGGRRTGRTKYRPDVWALPEWLVTGCGVVAAAATFVNVKIAPEQMFLASVTMVPPVPVLACAGILVAALPAVLAPPLPVVRPTDAPRPRTAEEVAA